MILERKRRLLFPRLCFILFLFCQTRVFSHAQTKHVIDEFATRHQQLAAKNPEGLAFTANLQISLYRPSGISSQSTRFTVGQYELLSWKTLKKEADSVSKGIRMANI